ncbi:phosphotransferase [Frigidibacter sp. RF13]|uniref:aminoglycoside phosphotransferase family protein n=1 Tax=Frigidibacter sp. RF13 TaxID=2997340 RepID=UPI00226FDFBF|nr:phosphotransferase [Frigidibacter sp. RF13]MCY1126631.1 phosphotransferase [Frigidibacter sp. RF13]
MNDRRHDEARAFVARADWGNGPFAPLAGDASARRYFRLPGGAVLMDADPATGERVERFLAVGDWLLDHGYSAPKILARDPDRGFLLLEDLGDALFARVTAADPAMEAPLYGAAVTFLADLSQQVPPSFVAAGDGAALARLVTLLNDHYLPALGAPPLAELPGLIAALYEAWNDQPPVLSLRDFHAENLIWLPDRQGARRAGLLDFQDAFATHPAYDLVSLLQDARRDVSAETAEASYRAYLDLTGFEERLFARVHALIGAQRALRILAVFAKLARADGKPHYLAYAPRVAGHLRRSLAHPALGPLAACVAREVPELTAERLERLRVG